MFPLPSISYLIQRTKALAALDAILSPEWEYRFYSFNANWTLHEQMASMRDGCGNEWNILFHSSDWAALRGLTHESEAWCKGGTELSLALESVMPVELSEFAEEPAFSWEATSFAYYCVSDKIGWQRANDQTIFMQLNANEERVLRDLTLDHRAYAARLEEYYEKPLPRVAVESILNLEPISNDIVKALNPQIILKTVEEELFDDIGYPRR